MPLFRLWFEVKPGAVELLGLLAAPMKTGVWLAGESFFTNDTGN